MKVMTVLGTRPEIIRLSQVIPLLDEYGDHTLVHTGQNFEPRLSDVFFKELGVREPDVYLGVHADGFAGQVGQMFSRIEPLFQELRPERLLILGDTNSGLVSVVAKRLGIQVFHMEAGNRCFDDRVPEEINRRVIDHSSSVLMPYTHRSKENLLAEGIPRQRVYVTGNPIKEVLDYYQTQIGESSILADLDLEEDGFFLVTIHRAENVDDAQRLKSLVEALEMLQEQHQKRVIFSVHPRTRSKLKHLGREIAERVELMEPLGFFDFVRLEQAAFCLLSDSGTVQEEACIFGKPNVTLRDVTERPETIEAGSNILSGAQPESILEAVRLVTNTADSWKPPDEYLLSDVSRTVAKILFGYLETQS